MFQKGISSKGQSAMEYLMTYGWAILIIAVVLGALFALGVFSGSTLLGTSCVASPGYLCSNPIMLPSTNGQLDSLSLTIGQNTGNTHSSAYIYCGNQSSTMNSNGAGFTAVGNNAGGNYIANEINGGTFASGTEYNIFLQCAGFPGTSQAAVSTVGTAFTGYIWEVYASGGANVVTKIATVTVKVS
jgi:hypothetical protein